MRADILKNSTPGSVTSALFLPRVSVGNTLDRKGDCIGEVIRPAMGRHVIPDNAIVQEEMSLIALLARYCLTSYCKTTRIASSSAFINSLIRYGLVK